MASDRDQLLKAFISASKSRRKRKVPFTPDYPSGGRNLMSVAKGRSDVNQSVGRLPSTRTFKPRKRRYKGVQY